MAQGLGVLVAFPGGNTTPSSGLCGPCMHTMYRHTCRKNIHTHKTKLKNIQNPDYNYYIIKQSKNQSYSQKK